MRIEQRQLGEAPTRSVAANVIRGSLGNLIEWYDAKGHPERRAFKLGKTNSNISTTGLSATVGVFVAATGTSSDLTLDALKDPHVREFVGGVEKSVAHYG